ncbi:MAG: SDR family NAD(P)-dependent oxidoreductase [Thermodesulfobacteriota bacterium]
MPFSGKNIVITGGASGIGKALARLFVEDGANVVLVDLNGPGVAKTAAELADSCGRKVWSLQADMGDYDAVCRAVSDCVSALETLDVFVNNAGIGVSGEFVQNTREEIDAITRVNYLGMVYGSHAACRRFTAQGFGHLVNVASVAGLYGFPKMSLYCGTKAGIVVFSQALRFEMKRKGIHVSVALPSTTDTPMILDKMDLAEGEEDPAPGILMAIPMCRTDAVAAAIFAGIAKRKFFIFPTLTDRGTLFLRNFASPAFNAFISAVGFKTFEKKRRKLCRQRDAQKGERQ